MGKELRGNSIGAWVRAVTVSGNYSSPTIVTLQPWYRALQSFLHSPTFKCVPLLKEKKHVLRVWICKWMLSVYSWWGLELLGWFTVGMKPTTRYRHSSTHHLFKRKLGNTWWQLLFREAFFNFFPFFRHRKIRFRYLIRFRGVPRQSWW